MSDPKARQQAYENVLPDGTRYGQTGRRDEDRWKQTLRFIPRGTTSLLDVGCDIGEWLNFVSQHRNIPHLVGIDIARNKVVEGKALFPHLDLRSGYAEDLANSGEKFDVVTAMEVLEHVPQWEHVLAALFKLATRTVLVTVPYKEQITYVPCIHCGKMTSLYGHLTSFDESTFPQQDGWSLEFGYIKKRTTGSDGSIIHKIYKIYRRLRPRRNWLVAKYTSAEVALHGLRHVGEIR